MDLPPHQKTGGKLHTDSGIDHRMSLELIQFKKEKKEKKKKVVAVVVFVLFCCWLFWGGGGWVSCTNTRKRFLSKLVSTLSPLCKRDRTAVFMNNK